MFIAFLPFSFAYSCKNKGFYPARAYRTNGHRFLHYSFSPIYRGIDKNLFAPAAISDGALYDETVFAAASLSHKPDCLKLIPRNFLYNSCPTSPLHP